mmetsp:Transcript_43000/g.100884  ORF Transcript_43000/g.100884 Transcript_43000/m.100884 type:complete len:258 (-) Transcript_43000:562-1335(-)
MSRIIKNPGTARALVRSAVMSKGMSATGSDSALSSATRPPALVPELVSKSRHSMTTSSISMLNATCTSSARCSSAERESRHANSEWFSSSERMQCRNHSAQRERLRSAALFGLLASGEASSTAATATSRVRPRIHESESDGLSSTAKAAASRVRPRTHVLRTEGCRSAGPLAVARHVALRDDLPRDIDWIVRAAERSNVPKLRSTKVPAAADILASSTRRRCSRNLSTSSVIRLARSCASAARVRARSIARLRVLRA